MPPKPRKRIPAARRGATLQPGVPEYAVDRATLMTFFRPPVSESTFYKLQQGGYIVPVEGVSGRYRLNASLSRLGLKPVAAAWTADSAQCARDRCVEPPPDASQPLAMPSEPHLARRGPS